MDHAINIILQNIQSVGKLSVYPTHQLRVLHTMSCLPEIVHETRLFPAIVRFLSGDSRCEIIKAFRITLNFIESGLLRNKGPTSILIKQCEDGLYVLRNRYEGDINTIMQVDALITQWKVYSDM